MTTHVRQFDYDTAARTYDAHRHGRGPYFPVLLRLSAACPAGAALEIGAGTGNNTRAFIEDTRRPLVAIEPSRGMLARGRAKAAGARWLRARTEALPFREETFAFVFGTYMLHHVHDLQGAFSACFRCMGRGSVAFVTVSHAFIEAHPMNAYFPSFAAVDKARFQPIEVVVKALTGAGFQAASAEYTYAEPQAIDAEYANKISAKFISTYALLPQGEFEVGLERLRVDIDRHGGALRVPMVREAVVVYAWKH